MEQALVYLVAVVLPLKDPSLLALMVCLLAFQLAAPLVMDLSQVLLVDQMILF